MRQPPDISEILKKNPQLDASTLVRYRKMLEMLKKYRISKKQYDLASPMDERRVVAGDKRAMDSRTVDLSFLKAI